MLLALSMLLLGVVHGLGPDHCLAVSALACERRPAAVVRVAFRFAVAHSAVLLLVTGALRALGGSLSERWEHAGEMLNGTLLILLGLGVVGSMVAYGSLSALGREWTARRGLSDSAWRRILGFVSAAIGCFWFLGR